MGDTELDDEGPVEHTAVLDALAIGVIVVDDTGRIVHANARALAEGMAVGQNVLFDAPIPAVTGTGRPYPDQARPGAVALRTGRAVRDAEMGVPLPDGTLAWISTDAVPIAFHADGRPSLITITFRDMTDLWEQRVELEARVATEQLLASLSRELGAATSATVHGSLQLTLARLAAHLGAVQARLEPCQPEQYDEREAEVGGPDALVVPLRVEGDLLGTLVIEPDAPRRWSTGERSTVEQVAAVIASTMGRVRAEAILEYEANHDALTGLPQRKLVLEHLDRTLASPAGHDAAAVMFIDLDHFKRVNDSLGHAAGDRLLELFSQRLLTGVRGGDVAGRLGGDEFVVVCAEISGADEALAVGERLLELVEAPFSIDGVEVFVGASIGIAIADGTSDSATLLRHADTAAYRAKEMGRNRCELFDDALRAEVHHRLATESALRRALERSELRLHYQPIVRTVDASICGFEALVRWQRPGIGLVAPDDFLAIAEDSGLIVPIGLEVLRMGCQQAAEWAARFGADAPTVCINLSVLQLVQADFLGSFRSILAETGADPSQVILEITESSIMRDPARTVALLDELRALGLGLAIDDFGTGYSSLSHLRQLPVDELKIDRSFVFGIGIDQEGATIVASIVALAHALGMQIVAEGVETVEHVASLHNLGCDRMQGFYFSPALPADVATAMVARGHLRGPNAVSA